MLKFLWLWVIRPLLLVVSGQAAFRILHGLGFYPERWIAETLLGVSVDEWSEIVLWSLVILVSVFLVWLLEIRRSREKEPGQAAPGPDSAISSWQQEWAGLADVRHTFWLLINRVYDNWSPTETPFSEVLRKANLPVELPLENASAFPEWVEQYDPIDTDEFAAALDQIADEIYPRSGISRRPMSGAEFESFDNARRVLAKFWDKWGRKEETHGGLLKEQAFWGSSGELKLLTFLEIARARWVTTAQQGKDGLFDLARRANGSR